MRSATLRTGTARHMRDLRHQHMEDCMGLIKDMVRYEDSNSDWNNCFDNLDWSDTVGGKLYENRTKRNRNDKD